MIRWVFVLTLFCCASLAHGQDTASNTDQETASRHLLIVQGVAGTDEFGERFADWAAKWESAGKSFGFRAQIIDGTDELSSREKMESVLKLAEKEDHELWIVLIGHGTFDGELAKLNLVGEDVTAREIRGWLGKRTAPTIIINCTSCSAPFIDELSGNNRVVVTATKSGYEMSFCHFGQFLADAVSENQIDLDKDQQTSLLEAVVVASSQTEEFYKADSRLATEHALVDDNGDGMGTPISWFRGVRVTRQAKDGTPADGLKANQIFFSNVALDAGLSAEQLQRRNRLEAQIENLRMQRSQLTEDQYYHELEPIMLELARLYQQAGASDAETDTEPTIDDDSSDAADAAPDSVTDDESAETGDSDK